MIWKHKAQIATSKQDKYQAGGNSTGKLGEQKGFKGGRVTSGLQSSVIPHIFEVIPWDYKGSYTVCHFFSPEVLLIQRRNQLSATVERNMTHAFSIMKL